jgi:O-antigen/teichoic acid export membrane protein
MISFSKAILAFMTSSVIGTVTQVAKGKLSAVFLGTEGVGVYNQVSLFFSLIITICVLGFPNGITRKVALEHEGENWSAIQSQLSSFFFFLGLVSLSVCALVVMFSSEISELLFDDGGERATLVSLMMLGVPFATQGYVYRALFNGLRSVHVLVKSRIKADVISVGVFAGLIIPFGIQGAILGFVSLHILYLSFLLVNVKRVAPELGTPKPSNFHLGDVRNALGFGLHGLAVAIVGGLTTLVVSRWIISNSNLSDAGLFSVAYKVASVYLAGMYAAATGHYYASVAKAQGHESVNNVINGAIRIYMSIIPPIVGVLISAGGLLMIAFFSADFVPAATLLLLLLPADIFRLVSEVVGQALVAKNRLLPSFAIYSAWVLTYLGLAYFLVETHGLWGVAAAYLFSQMILLVLMICAGMLLLSYRPDKQTVGFFLRGLVLATACAVSSYFLDEQLHRILAGSFFIVVWGLVSLINPEFRSLAARATSKIVLPVKGIFKK